MQSNNTHLAGQNSPINAAQARLELLLPLVKTDAIALTPLEGKKPLLKNWPNTATSCTATLQRQAAQFPSCNWGICTGRKSDIVALDIDGSWAIEKLAELEKEHGVIKGPRVKTGGGGIHLYFKFHALIPNGLRVSREGEKGEFLACSDGRQLVAPGSKHPVTGHDYAWVPGHLPAEDPLTTPPDWLIEWLLSNANARREPKKRKGNADDNPGGVVGPRTPTAECRDAVPQGERNHALHAWVCEKVFTKLNARQAVDNLSIVEGAQDFNASHLVPPFPRSELRNRVTRSVARAQEDWQASRKQQARGLKRAGVPTATVEVTWTPPVLFDADSGPPFPTGALDRAPWLRDLVVSVSDAFQVPQDMPGLIGLAMISGALQRFVSVSPKKGWTEPIPLYLCIAAEPGTNKSQVHSLLVSPALKWEERVNIETAPERREHAAHRRILTARIDRLEKQGAAKESSAERKIIRDEIADLRAEIERTPSGAPMQWLYDDATAEILEKGMADNQEVAILTSAEGRVFDQLSSNDRAPNLNIYLKAHCGDELRVNRVSRDSVYIKRPMMTIAVMTQPDVVAGLAAKRELAGRGVLARFLFSIPQNRVGSRLIDVPAVDGHLVEKYSGAIADLLEFGRCGEQVQLRFADDCAKEFAEFRTIIENRLHPDSNDLSGLANWASKLAGHTVRLSGILHVAENLHDWKSKLINLETIRSAIHIAEYSIEHARVAFGLMAADVPQRDAQYLAGNMIKLAGRCNTSYVKRHEIWQATKRHFRTAESLNRSLEILESRGYIAVRRLPGDGVKSAEVYYINPALLAGDHSSTNNDDIGKNHGATGALEAPAQNNEFAGKGPNHE